MVSCKAGMRSLKYKDRVLAFMTIIFMCATVLNSCSEKEEPEPVPVITKLSPSSALLGEIIYIHGQNFSTDPTANIVEFTGISAIAEVSNATATNLIVTVPLKAQSGKIKVTVNGQTAISPDNFKLLHPPIIQSFYPASGPIGSPITIEGAYFADYAEPIVRINSVRAQIVSFTYSKISVVVPPNATTGKISVEVLGMKAESNAIFEVSPLAQFYSFSPVDGCVETIVTVTGKNFVEDLTAYKAWVHNTEAEVISVTPTTVTMEVPVSVLSGKISISVYGVKFTSPNDFTVLPFPYVTSVVPSYGFPGDVVTINGTDFNVATGGNTVSFNGAEANILEAGDNMLKVIVPPSATTGDLIVSWNGTTCRAYSSFHILQDVPRNGLRAFYPFHSGSGTETVTMNPLYGFADANSTAVDRFVNEYSALEFEGPYDEHLNVNAPMIPLQPWTISFWIKYESLTEDSGILSTLSGDVGMDITLEKRGTSFVVVTSGYDGSTPGSEYKLSDPSLVNGYLPESIRDWTNITLTYDGNTYKVFKDGTLVETHVNSVITSIGPELNFGRSSDKFFFGSLDDLIIYDRAISSSEVIAVVNQTMSRFR